MFLNSSCTLDRKTKAMGVPVLFYCCTGCKNDKQYNLSALSLLLALSVDSASGYGTGLTIETSYLIHKFAYAPGICT